MVWNYQNADCSLRQKNCCVICYNFRHTFVPCMVPELIPVLGSQPTGDVSHKPGGRLPLLSARPVVTPATRKRAATNFAANWWTEAQWVWTVCLRLLPNSVAANPSPTAPESSTLTTRLPSHPSFNECILCDSLYVWDTRFFICGESF